MVIETIKNNTDNLIVIKKSCSTTHHEGALVERRYSFYSYSSSAIVVSVTPRSRFAPEKGPPVPIV
jgi:hypothetical protein